MEKATCHVDEEGGVSAPDRRRELRHTQKGGGAERARGQGVANERRGRGAVESGRAARESVSVCGEHGIVDRVRERELLGLCP